jgi:hypothetical protein
MGVVPSHGEQEGGGLSRADYCTDVKDAWAGISAETDTTCLNYKTIATTQK